MRTRWDRVDEKNSEFFTCGHNSLLSTLKALYKTFCESPNEPKVQFFKFRFSRLRGLVGQTNVRNRLVWPQMTSQIAGIDILHILAK